MKPVDIAKAKAQMDAVEDAPTECGGQTLIVHGILCDHQIHHQVFFGYVDCPELEKRIENHWWIELGDFVIDYRLRMWTNPTAPHGWFKKNPCGFSYQGKTQYVPPPPQWLVELLIGG